MKKLPENAKLMFEGVRYNIWQWEQPLFDGSTAIFEAAARADSVTLICTVGEKILILEEQQPGQEPFLALPGGHREGLEAIERTAKKKLLHEAGYEVHDLKSWFTAPYGWVLGDNYYYICRNVTKVAEPSADPGDKILVKFLSFDEFIEFRTSGLIRNKELLPILERAANNSEEKDKLYKEIFGSPEELEAARQAAVKAEEDAAKKLADEAEKQIALLKAEAEKEAEARAQKLKDLEAMLLEARKKTESSAPVTLTSTSPQEVQRETVPTVVSGVSPVTPPSVSVSGPAPAEKVSPFAFVPNVSTENISVFPNETVLSQKNASPLPQDASLETSKSSPPFVFTVPKTDPGADQDMTNTPSL